MEGYFTIIYEIIIIILINAEELMSKNNHARPVNESLLNDTLSTGRSSGPIFIE